MPDTGAVKRPVAKFNPVPRRKAPLARGCKVRRADPEKVPSTLNNYDKEQAHVHENKVEKICRATALCPQNTPSRWALSAFGPTKGKMIRMRHENALFAHCPSLLTHLDSDCAYCIPMLCWSQWPLASTDVWI